jgi:hypothetical protein
MNKRRAIIIGQGYASNDKLKLNCTLNDANDMHDLLSSYGFNVDYAKKELAIIAETRHKSYILKEITDIVADLGEEDDFVFFFSGHGEYKKDDLYLYLDGYSLGKEANYTITRTEILNILNPKKIRNKVYILDCCEADAFNDGKAKNMNININEQVVGLFNTENAIESTKNLEKNDFKSNIYVLAACDRNEQAKELDGWQNSFFTHYLLELIKEQPDKEIEAKYFGNFEDKIKGYEKNMKKIDGLPPILPKPLVFAVIKNPINAFKFNLFQTNVGMNNNNSNNPAIQPNPYYKVGDVVFGDDNNNPTAFVSIVTQATEKGYAFDTTIGTFGAGGDIYQVGISNIKVIDFYKKLRVGSRFFYKSQNFTKIITSKNGKSKKELDSVNVKEVVLKYVDKDELQKILNLPYDTDEEQIAKMNKLKIFPIQVEQNALTNPTHDFQDAHNNYFVYLENLSIILTHL